MKHWPYTHLGWHQYYVKRFNKNEHPDAAYLAMVYLFLHLRDTDECCNESSAP